MSGSEESDVADWFLNIFKEDTMTTNDTEARGVSHNYTCEICKKTVPGYYLKNLGYVCPKCSKRGNEARGVREDAERYVNIFLSDTCPYPTSRDMLIKLVAHALERDREEKAVKLDTGNLIDDPLYKAFDALYSRGWEDQFKKRSYDPRGTNEWQRVLDLFRRDTPDAAADKALEEMKK